MHAIDLPALRQRLEDLPPAAASRLASVLAYPHPLTGGGLLCIFRDTPESLASELPEILSRLPQDFPARCLRRSELWELALPGHFMPPLVVNELPHLPFWARHRGELVYGEDLRSEIPVPTFSGILLAGHIDGCRRYLRVYSIVRRLMDHQHATLIRELREQALHLMATALLERGHWEIDLASLPDTFAHQIPDGGLAAFWRGLDQRCEQIDPASGEASADAARQAAWCFESFLQRLEEVLG